MKGFTSDALILLPAYEDYKEAYGGYKEQLQLSVENIISYLKSVEITPVFLTTDPLAGILYAERDDLTWLATENPGGMYFIQKNLHVPAYTNTVPLAPEYLQDLDKKFPVERGCTIQQRCFVESKRVNRAEKLLIAAHKVVFLFGKQYNLRSKPDDGRALFFINSQFIPKLKLSGYDANINSFLGFPRANMAITEWRVSDG